MVDPSIRRGFILPHPIHEATCIFLKPHPNDEFDGRGTLAHFEVGQADVTAQLISELKT